MVNEAIKTDIQHEYIGNTVGVHGPLFIFIDRAFSAMNRHLALNNDKLKLNRNGYS